MRPAAEFKAGGGGGEVGGTGVFGGGDDVGTRVAGAAGVADAAEVGSDVGLALVASVATATVAIATPESAVSFPPRQEQRLMVAAKTIARKTCLAGGGADIHLDLTGYDRSARRHLRHGRVITSSTQ